MAPQTAPRVGSDSRADSRATLLAAIQETWSGVLGTDRIGPDDDFFACGGTSLGLATAAALLGERFGIDLPLSLPEIERLADEAARRTEERHAYVRVTVTRGPAGAD